ncbi:helix-turn-helix transcriptional regulator [Actinoplanes sp. NPDC048967]|uniref:helix-turn-helix domain-containing protein n=1 Tax=Actinoplanes sp. NPDC048967 TaxID=3155269 RepID=UPI0033CC6C32
MTEGDSPTVARRRIRLALREARDAAGLTQLQVAEEMEWSLSKVIRIENGDVTIAPNDLRPLLSFYGIKDRKQVSDLLTSARIARARQRQAWYQAPEFRELLSDATRRHIEYESEAVAVRSYSIYYLPGYLQTEQYAAALTGTFDPEDIGSLERIQLLIRARRTRQETLFARAGNVQVFVLLDESVFMRPIGGAQVFAEQLSEIRRRAGDGLIHLRMLPFNLDRPIANNGSYELLALRDRGADSEILYRENGISDEIIEDRATTGRHRRRFEQLWHLSNDEPDTIRFLDTRIKDLETQSQSRQRS